MLVSFRLLIVLSLGAIAQSVHAQKTVTNGTMSVSPDGALQYSIPIAVPPGPNGLQPNLALAYNSRAGDGGVGVGWSLSGFSMVLRCPKTLAQDGKRAGVKMLMEDAYCLDGQRLIPVKGVNGADGTEYRTELDMFAKITSLGSYDTSSGGPLMFVVITKSGLRMQYGGPNAQVLNPGNDTPSRVSNPIRGWALSRVSDQFLNTIRITYTNRSQANRDLEVPIDDGVFYPTGVTYGGNGVSVARNIGLVWHYSNYIQPPIKYQAGYALPHSDKYINAITSSVGGSPFRQYQITSSRVTGRTNKIVSIAECDYSPTIKCLEPLKFDGDAVQTNLFRFSNGAVPFPSTRIDFDEFFVDVNGDGRKSWLRISQGTDEAWFGSATSNGDITTDRWMKYAQPIGSTGDYSHHFADIDGDGKADWIRVSRATNEAWRALGTGNGGFQPWVQVTGTVTAANTAKHYFADVSGDGRADWIQITPAVGSGAGALAVAFATGAGNFDFWTHTKSELLDTWELTFADVNDDGMADQYFLSSSGHLNIKESKGDGSFSNVYHDVPYEAGAKFSVADLNGDGNFDVLKVTQNNSVYKIFSKGKSTFAEPIYIGKSYAGGSTRTGDIDGDGMEDVLFLADGAPTGSTATVIRTGAEITSDNTRTITLSPTGGMTGNNDIYLQDLNGDGKADLIMVSKATKQAWVAISIVPSPGRIVSISSTGVPSTDITYKPLTDPSVYTPDSDAVYPLRDAMFPMQHVPRIPVVVASIATPNGIGGKLTTNYSYGGAKTDLSGRGFMGMRWNQVTQADTGITTRNEFRLDWPYTGRPTMTKTMRGPEADSGLLSQTTYTYGCTDLVSGNCVPAPGLRYFPYTITVAGASWDLNGTALPTTTTSFQYDEFGNVTRNILEASDGFRQQTDTVYSNDVAKWRIGRPVRVTNTKTSP